MRWLETIRLSLGPFRFFHNKLVHSHKKKNVYMECII